MNITTSNGEDGSGYGFWFLPAVIIGVVGFWVHFAAKDEILNEQFEILLQDAAPALSLLGFGACYGIIVGPYWREDVWAWVDGWMVFVAIGILPLILTLNDLLTELRQARKQKPENVHSLHRKS